MSDLCDGRMRWLIAAHLGFGLVVRLFVMVEMDHGLLPLHTLFVPFFASALSQAFLLAVWGAASPAPFWRRLAGLTAGAVYLEALIPGELRREVLGLCSFTIGLSVALLLIVRWWLGVGFDREAEPGGRPSRPLNRGSRASIGSLMQFTAAVALLCAGAKAVRGVSVHYLLPTSAWASCFVAVGLISLWAAIGPARPARRSPIVLILAPVIGGCFALYLGADREGVILFVLILLLYATAVLASLLVIRSCGVRLRGGRPRGAKMGEG